MLLCFLSLRQYYHLPTHLDSCTPSISGTFCLSPHPTTATHNAFLCDVPHPAPLLFPVPLIFQTLLMTLCLLHNLTGFLASQFIINSFLNGTFSKTPNIPHLLTWQPEIMSLVISFIKPTFMEYQLRARHYSRYLGHSKKWIKTPA